MPYLRHIRNTSSSWAVRIILADLYGWREPIDAGQLAAARREIRERADDRAWHIEVLDRLTSAARGPSCAEGQGGGRRPAPVRAGVGLLHALPVGRVRHGAL